MPNVVVSTPSGTRWFESCVPHVSDNGTLYVLPSGSYGIEALIQALAIYPPNHWVSATSGVLPEEEGEFLTGIADFMRAGEQHVPELALRSFTPARIQLYLDRVESELDETANGIAEENREEVVDGFLDIAYAAFTGALTVAGEKATREAWAAILRANTSKIDGSLGPVRVDEITGKVLKPEGWKAPDIKGILERNS